MALTPIQQMAMQTAQQYGIPTNLFLNLVRQESGFNPNARSSAGALGLTQLMPATARGLGVSNPLSPAENLAGGARYLSDQFKRFKRWDLALAAYNAGPGAVQKYGGVPPYAETQNYVSSIMGGGKTSGAGQQRQQMQAMTAMQPSLGMGGISPRIAFAQNMAATMGLRGSDWSQAVLGAVQGLRAGLANQTNTMSQQQQMSNVMTGGAVQGGATGATGINSDFQSRLQALMEAVKQQGGNLTINSGYRSVAEQQVLWDQALKKYGSAAAARRWVAPPGNSMHNKGLAADLGGSLELAHQLAPRFGLTFPLSNENWHIEPLGARNER